MNVARKKIRIKAKPLPIAIINMCSTDIRVLEQCIESIREYSLKHQYRYSGPVSFSTQKLKVNTRRGPSGEGSGTHFYYEQKVWRKQIKLYHEQVVNYVLQETNNTEAMRIQIELV